VTGYAEALRVASDTNLAPVLTEAGFTRASRRPLEWTRGDRLQIRVQLDSRARDPYAGGAFKVEFEVSEDGRFGHKLSGRVIAEQLFDERQRGTVLAQRNLLAREWGRPPSDHLALIPVYLHQQYLKPFSQLESLEREFGMRFRTSGEAAEWLDLLAREMPTLIASTESLSPRVLYLGKPIDWEEPH